MPAPGDVVNFPLSDSLTVEQALGAAAKRALKQVISIGVNDEGRIVIVSSNMPRAHALRFAEMLKRHVLDDELT